MHVSSSSDGFYVMSDEHTGVWATDCLAGPFQSAAAADAAMWELDIKTGDTEFVPPSICQACIMDDHDDCADGGISSSPYWCECAANRHGYYN